MQQTWVDGLIHSTDNLQITIVNQNKKAFLDPSVTIQYYDKNGKELGHNYDIGKEKILQNEVTRFSLLLLPPDETNYSVLEIGGSMEESKFLHSIYEGIIFLGIAVFIASFFKQ